MIELFESRIALRRKHIISRIGFLNELQNMVGPRLDATLERFRMASRWPYVNKGKG